MENEELKEKMVKIIINAIWKDAEADYDSTDESEAISIADALIAAGYGDVSSEKAMRELAEAFHREKCAEYDLLNYQIHKSECRIAEAEHRVARAERKLKEFAGYVGCERCLYSYRCELPCVDSSNDYRACFETYVREAEKELAEDGKNYD